MKIILEGIKVELDHTEHISKLWMHVKPYFSDFGCSGYLAFWWILSQKLLFPIHKRSQQKQITTIFKIAEPPNFRLYPHRNIHLRDEISCSDIANYVKFLLKKVSFEKNTNSWKFFNFSIFFSKKIFLAVCRQYASNDFSIIFSWVCRHIAGKHSFPEKKI